MFSELLVELNVTKAEHRFWWLGVPIDEFVKAFGHGSQWALLQCTAYSAIQVEDLPRPVSFTIITGLLQSIDFWDYAIICISKVHLQQYITYKDGNWKSLNPSIRGHFAKNLLLLSFLDK